MKSQYDFTGFGRGGRADFADLLRKPAPKAGDAPKITEKEMQELMKWLQDAKNQDPGFNGGRYGNTVPGAGPSIGPASGSKIANPAGFNRGSTLR